LLAPLGRRRKLCERRGAILNDEKFERTSHPVIVVKLRKLAAYLARLFDGMSQNGRGSGGGYGRYAS